MQNRHNPPIPTPLDALLAESHQASLSHVMGRTVRPTRKGAIRKYRVKLSRSCRKCQHVNTDATWLDGEVCPRCGTPYLKTIDTRFDSGYGASRFTDATTRPPPGFGPTRPSPRRINFILARFREQTHYATFRQNIWIFVLLGYLMASVAAVGAFRAFWMHDMQVGLLNAGLILLSITLAHFLKDFGLFIADACDALVRMAVHMTGLDRL